MPLDPHTNEKKSKKVIIFALDYDGCLTNDWQTGDFAHTLLGNQHKRITSSNDTLINWMIKAINEKKLPSLEGKEDEAITVYVINGSNRNSFKIDINNQIRYGSGSCFSAIKAMYETIAKKYQELYQNSNVEFKFDSYLLADTYGNKKDGENFQNALDAIAVYDAIERITSYYYNCCNFINIRKDYKNNATLFSELKKELERIKQVHLQFKEPLTDNSLQETMDALLNKLDKDNVSKFMDLTEFEEMQKKFHSAIYSSINTAMPIIQNSPILTDKKKTTLLKYLEKIFKFFSELLNSKKNCNLLEIQKKCDEQIDPLDRLRDGVKKSHKANHYFKYTLDRCLLDESKFILVWMQLQRAALEHPDALIEYTLIDDRSEILESLLNFLKDHSELIPKNAKVSVVQYEHKEKQITTKDSFEAIQGTREPHPNPELALRQFRDAYEKEIKEKEITNVNAIDLLTGLNKETYLNIFKTRDVSLKKDAENTQKSNQLSLQKNTIFSPPQPSITTPLIQPKEERRPK